MCGYLAARWHHLTRHRYALGIRIDTINHAIRVDALPANGPPGSDPILLKRQLLDEAGVDVAVLNHHNSGNLPDPVADGAWCAAINEWQAATWIGEYNWHGRYRASIRLPAHNPAAAIEQIERWAENPYFVQALAVHAYQPAFGHPMYEPIWRAAAEHGLPVAVHATNHQLGTLSSHITPYGQPSFLFEWHTAAYPAVYASHLASLICSGIFERIPELKFVMVEGGIGWSLALGSHLDRNWRLLRSEVPDLKELPSHYLRRNVFFTTQPIEEPFYGPEPVLQAWEQLDANRRLLFATDYPHWDFDDPKQALPRLRPELKRRVMVDNARELYALPHDRPAD
jgi:predicted TIM-barrel fold metal-dependent hydrolase